MKTDILFRSCSVFFVTLGCLIFSGCSEEKPDGMPKLYPVNISFTQGSEPCAEASIRLVPEGANPWLVGGTTNLQGVVSLKTHGKYKGAPAGKYRVLATKTETITSGPAASMYESVASETFNLIEEQYSVPTETPLEIEVIAGTNNFKPIDLGAKIRLPIKKPGDMF